MNRKDKIQYLRSLASGNETLLNHWPPLCIDSDGTDIFTGKPPTIERIAEAKPFGYVQFTNGTDHPDWAEIYGLKN